MTEKDFRKKQTGVRLDPVKLKKMKFLSVELERSLTSLFEEAVNDFLEKYKSKGE